MSFANKIFMLRLKSLLYHKDFAATYPDVQLVVVIVVLICKM